VGEKGNVYREVTLPFLLGFYRVVSSDINGINGSLTRCGMKVKKLGSLFDHVAEKTLDLIDKGIEKDNGKKFKECEKKWFGQISDAWKADSGELRDHLGASQIGGDCLRKVWLGFRTRESQPSARLIRLWNRGHLEEARILALLEQAGIEVWNDRGDGRQFGYKNGIFAGSIDGLAYNIPDCENEIVMLEFKTMNDKNFDNFVARGIGEFPQYERQCHVNMHCMNIYADTHEIFTSLIQDKTKDLKSQRIEHTLFLAVNKNNDDIHGVIVKRNDLIAEQMLARVPEICNNKILPDGISDRESYYICKMCGFADFCYGNRELSHNCRTCMMQNFENGELSCAMGGDKFSEDCYMGIDFKMTKNKEETA